MKKLNLLKNSNPIDKELIYPASTEKSIEKLTYKINEIIEHLNNTDKQVAGSILGKEGGKVTAKKGKNHFVSLGKKGGGQTAKRGPEYYRQIGLMGAAKRWGNRLKV